MYKINLDTQDSDNKHSKIQIFNNQYSSIEHAPLLESNYKIANYGTINSNIIVEKCTVYYGETYFNKKYIAYVIIILTSLMLGIAGVILLAFHYIEGFFVLILFILNVLLTRKIVNLWC